MRVSLVVSNPLLIVLRTTALLWLAAAPLVAGEAAIPLSQAIEARQVLAETRSTGSQELTISLRNTTANPINATIPAGLIAEGRTTPDRIVILRQAEATIPPQGTVDVTLPVAALSSKATEAKQPFALTTVTEPRLASLLTYLAGQPDAPRATAQLAVFCVLENLTYGQWIQLLSASAPGETHPTPAEITQAVDVLGILRQIAPQQVFALAGDSELKLRALRNPWCRVKAMQIYGLNVGDGALPPDLGQLLHTKPGDNCPICRQRAQLQQSPSDL